jgi:hypothetical protein
MRVIAIDPGISNLGVVVGTAGAARPGRSPLADFCVDRADRFSLCKAAGCVHGRVCGRDCALGHANSLPNRVLHFAQEYNFDEADVVVMERQPPQSAGYVVEQLLQAAFGSKIAHVTPREIQGVYGACSTDGYDERKAKACAYAARFLGRISSFSNLDRQHDVADAICAAAAHLQKRPAPRQYEVVPYNDCDTFRDFLQQFSHQ